MCDATSSTASARRSSSSSDVKKPTLIRIASRLAIVRTIASLDAIRISVGFFTSEEELERLAEAVELVASHTPETLPPRRLLTILGEG